MILHLDMDAFFASVEQLDNPDYRGKPLIVGGRERGVVTTASYEARRYGIHSAMPVSQARKLCPHGIFVPGRFGRYAELSRKVMECLARYAPIVEKASIDEAYIELEPGHGVFAEPVDIAIAIKKDIRQATGLGCSIGMAPIKFLAKICSDLNKPDGIFILAPEDTEAFLRDLPVGALPGVGKVMRASLEAFGIMTVGQLRKLSRQFLEERYGKFGAVLHDRAHGADAREVSRNRPARSESCEHTFSQDVYDKRFLRLKLREQAERVAASLRKRGNAGRTITLKLKYSDFRQITRSHTLNSRTCASEIIYGEALKLLERETLVKSVRLVGVGVSGFERKQEQYLLPGLETGGYASEEIRQERSGGHAFETPPRPD